MALETNAHNNYTVPASRVTPLVVGAVLAVSAFYLKAWWADEGFFESLPSILDILIYGVVAAVVAHLLLQIQGDLEFDDRTQVIRRGKRKLVRYDQVRAIEIRRRGLNEGPAFQVVLKLGTSRRMVIIETDDETTAALDAGSIARVIGTEVRVVT
jgi:hypothetical protein